MSAPRPDILQLQIVALSVALALLAANPTFADPELARVPAPGAIQEVRIIVFAGAAASIGGAAAKALSERLATSDE